MSEQAHLLVIDDDEANRVTLSALLDDLGYAVDEAANPPEARQLLRGDGMYRTVLLDWNLGVESGAVILPVIAEHQPGARVIVISGNGPDAGALNGVHAVHEKTADFEELVRKIESAGA